MVDPMSRPRRGRLPLGFLGAIALILAVEYSIDRQKLATLGGSQWASLAASSEADSGDKGCEILCFGDSLLKQGLAPTVIEAKSGFRGYNFALAGGQAPANYFLLSRALASGIRPRAVIVEYFPKLMSRDPDFNVENWPFLATESECLEMSRLTRDPTLLADLTLRELLPSVRCRNSIRANVLAALAGTFPIFANEIFSARRNWEVNRGAEILASRPDRVENIEQWMQGYFPSFKCTHTNRAYIKKLLELANRHEIPVFWILPPYKPELQARCEQSGFDAVHEEFVRTLQTRYQRLYVIDARRAGYDSRVFTDLHHLGRDGAAIFSAAVGDVLRSYRDDPASTPRWLKLADFRPLATTYPLESMDESRVKVHEIVIKDPTSLLR
jgi:hypothetical protein